MDKRRKYDWKIIQEYYDAGHSLRDCQNKFGFATRAYEKAKKRGEFKLKERGKAVEFFRKQGRFKQEWSNERRQLASSNAIKNELGGHRNSIKIYYNGVWLDSTYELRVAKLLDAANIIWLRPKPIKWIDDDNITHRYYPDFYLPEYDRYLDPKNKFLIKKDAIKLNLIHEQSKIRVLIITLEQIIAMETNGIDINLFKK